MHAMLAAYVDTPRCRQVYRPPAAAAIYLGTPQPLKHKSVGLQINTSAPHPKHKSFGPTFDFQRDLTTYIYIYM